MAATHARLIGFAHLGSHSIVLGRDDDAYDAVDCCTIVPDWEPPTGLSGRQAPAVRARGVSFSRNLFPIVFS